MRRPITALLLAGLVFVALLFILGQYLAFFPWQQRPQSRNTLLFPSSTLNPSTTEGAIVPWSVEEVASGLEVPWSIVWTSPRRMLVTERPGRIRMMENGKLLADPIHTFAAVSSRSEEGLMGMTLDPDYATNRLLYVCYAYVRDGKLVDRIVRLHDERTRLTAETVVLDQIPAATNHAGCRIRFGPDKKLYITTGDATNRQIAQDKSSLGGKILRLNPDGSIPQDNPFPNSAVWSLGHRNPQGLDWHPTLGSLVATEHGPSVFDGPAGGDEINVIEKGNNYGWPLVSHDRNQAGLIAPILQYTPAVAPSAGLFYSSNVLPQFTNQYFFAMLRGEGVTRIRFSNTLPLTIVEFEKMPEINVGRVREVAQGPDGFIYFATSNRDGRGSLRDGDDKIYRLRPTTGAKP